ncbi:MULTISPECIES: ABC transporter ATP-binding protein [Brenneria]|uniref:ABC-type dipeptide transporter n=1 Tax=Brenneria nigrifluens DSM 30175 = ATCC 13028 TaxID=1121120 RepID=A0A2U1USY8_9GAMM|nr:MULTISPECIES: ABC transporter ATP-binding protein [Brenneria]EHD21703.1 oligopeptide/dipeptide ABC transporter, ATPase subunit [Brenneria sp. EniD312]PWC24760.1 ABC transporter ATP-binding protein [Brenneria nigrifluens DSM 30175 = ATCC 13028]QCR04817.1 ABC transporter ATP-binding protein [Brenneria nigrifluens DSM 30175 = ATCC 13028]
MNNEPILTVRDLRIAIPTEQGEFKVVRGVDFDLRAGETLCLVGESGCGKSITALSLLGLQTSKAKINARQMTFQGKALDKLSQRELDALRGRDIAIIFQDPMTTLNPTLSIERQMTEGVMRHEKIDRRQARERAVQLLEQVGIPQPAERIRQYPHQFSGGQRQRIIIAMALMGKPSLLIADEPTTALDVTIQAQILALIRDLARQHNFALLLITHDFGVVAAMADKVSVMYAGRIVESAPAGELLQRPMHPYTRGLIASIPVPGKTQPGSDLPVIEGRVPELLGEMDGCAFRWRCAWRQPVCQQTLPVRQTGEEHRYECVRTAEEPL